MERGAALVVSPKARKIVFKPVRGMLRYVHIILFFCYRRCMLPYSKQETEYYCGPAVVQMLLAHVGIIFTQAELAKELGTLPSVGTNADAIVALLTHHGMHVTRRNGATIADIRDALAAKELVLVGYIEADENVPHYVLVTAVTDDSIVFTDPDGTYGPNHSIPLTLFEERWRDDQANMYGDRLLITVS